MYLTPLQTLGIIGAVALGTILTRFLPFVLFPERKTPPTYVLYLGKVLPPAVIGLLVVYCFKAVSITVSPYGIPEAAAALCVVLLHLWKRNTLLSIGAGTVVYMILLQIVLPRILL